MRIAVCMKQVPARVQGDMDPETGVIRRDRLQTTVNRYDLSALEAALRIKDANADCRIDVFTMGPERAKELLRTAFAMGADNGYLICDRAFGGADVLATSYTLHQAIQAAGTYELILCGRQTTDGDTAQVSGALAQWMEVPHLNWVNQILELGESDGTVCVETEEEKLTLRLPMPCVLSVEQDLYQPRMPILRLKMAAKKKPITQLSLESFDDTDPEHYGLRGSATRVRKIYPPEPIAHQPVLQESAEAAARHILSHWRELR